MDDVLQNSAGSYDPRGRLDPRGFQAHVRFQTFAPDEALAPFVEHFWSIRWEHQTKPYRSEEVMHRPYVDAFVSCTESGVQGTFRGKRDYWASGSGRIVGVRFLPGAFHLFWKRPMTELQERVLPFHQVFPEADEARINEWLQADDEGVIQSLAAQLRSVGVVPDMNVQLIGEIITAVEEGLTTVAELAREFLRSERWLQQLFRDYLGMGAKWLIQRQRLLGAARRIREHRHPSWAELAYEMGYSSQQHFITDFKRVLGKTPVEYEKGLTPAQP